MNHLTVRGFDKALERRIREVAKLRGISLNQAAVLLLSEGAGLTKSLERPAKVGDALKKFAGRWTKAEEREFLKAIAPPENLREKGRPLPTNDIWIAAHAMETGADLVSFDAHFGQIDGLVWVDPSAA